MGSTTQKMDRADRVNDAEDGSRGYTGSTTQNMDRADRVDDAKDGPRG